MAENEHLEQLQKGVIAWNTWRKGNPDIRPDLSNADLTDSIFDNIDFSHADLRGAILKRAQLRGANLTEANLQGSTLCDAQLQDATLHKAHLLKTTLREAVLKNATLTEVTGMLPKQLAGTDVTGAQLPEGVGKFEALVNVKDLSDSAQKLFLAILGGCAYSVLTIANTTDARLLPNSSTSPLPIIQTEVPIASFYLVAPLVLLAIYSYFHLYLQRLWEGLADLPAFFPDGRSLDKVASSWLLNSLVCSHFTLLKFRDHRPHLYYLQKWSIIFLAWWAVPVTILSFWLRYLRRHDWQGTGWHIALVVGSFWFGILLYRLTCTTLRGRKKISVFKIYKLIAYAFGVILTGCAFYLLSLGPIEGDPKPFPWGKQIAHGKLYYVFSWMDGYEFRWEPCCSFLEKHWLPKYNNHLWMPNVFTPFGYNTCADLREAEVAARPEKWSGDTEKLKEELAMVKMVHLKGMNLRCARATKAFLVKADLDDADLRGADLREAQLQGARLNKNTKLQQASLGAVNLQGLDLQEAQLGGADLENALLQGVDLGGSDLQGAHLVNTHLEGANLICAYLKAAELVGAQLQGAVLAGAQLQEAHLQNAQLQGTVFYDAAGGVCQREANLQKANLQDADFTLSDLRLKVDLQKVVVWQQISNEKYILFPGSLEQIYNPPSPTIKNTLCDNSFFWREGCFTETRIADYDTELAKSLGELACADKYVARGIANRATKVHRRSPNRKLGSLLAEKLLDSKCEGGAALSSDLKKELDKIKNEYGKVQIFQKTQQR